jgi:hypothetical protein
MRQNEFSFKKVLQCDSNGGAICTKNQRKTTWEQARVKTRERGTVHHQVTIGVNA